MKKILLVYPTVHHPGMKRVIPFWLPPLNFATITGLTPEPWTVHLIDENVEDVDFEADCDVVAVTALTANSKRAYEICDEYKKREKTVLIGGPHVTVCPEEASCHANAVITGDAEFSWQKVLGDITRGELLPLYSPCESNLDEFAVPDRTCYKKGVYLTINTIQTTRGCPYNCSFCSIASRYKQQYGVKSIRQILKEIEMFENKKMPVFIVDDNVFVNRKRSKKLLKALNSFKIIWWSQADITIADDQELLDLAKESGCIKLVVGFESIHPKSLKSIGKKQNKVEDYARFIEKLHNTGILVNPSFSFGGTHDTPDIFEKTLLFLKNNDVMFATFNILTPLPGTRLFKEMKNQGKIIDTNWSHYDMGHPVFRADNITQEELKNGYNNICKEFYSLPAINDRIQKIKGTKKFDTKLILTWNLGYKKMLDTFGVFM